jgi:hypothetical protein
MSRAKKIRNIELRLELFLKENPQHRVRIATSLTSLIGPNIVVETPQYTGTVTVDFGESNIVRFDTYGYVHRFANPNDFHNFFVRTLNAPLHAVHKLCGEIGGNTMGNSIILTRNGASYYIVEVKGGFDVTVNNETTTMTYDDIVTYLGK